ncbi:DUF5681 domain-containing protein [Methylobacterium soli]|uniref:DUF5681 domain-containing protein n=1 Tax=Methylobacterium soli TaxID=553447 RepID=A0A6L3SWV1_9HYPH|nr:DUF5681 domain-containing protein [Methylobacterium soli]KAB1072525.1 hypothetical protein F6X53_27965 [Methylobacterium soli]GJE43840.1 hypothetical protein AEGHOMDF_3019 [Methylobacterium soli]
MPGPGKPFAPGQSANPAGRPKGSRGKAALALEKLFDGEAEAIGRRAITLAKQGDGAALRLCLDRIYPVRRDRPVTFELPPIESSNDLTKATRALLDAVAEGEITPSEAEAIGQVVKTHILAIETHDLAQRVAELEAGENGAKNERA